MTNSLQKSIDIKNAYITFKKDFPEIFKTAYDKLIKYIASLLPIIFEATLNSMPLKINSSSKPVHTAKTMTQISISFHETVIFINAGLIIKNPTNPNGSPNKDINNCLYNLLKVKPNAVKVKPMILAIINPAINNGMLTTTKLRIVGIPAEGIDTLITLIIGMRVKAK